MHSTGWGKRRRSMTRNTDGETVTLSNRDWGRILITLISGLAIIVASWSTVTISVARLEEQVSSLKDRIGLLEDTVRKGP